MKKPFGPALLVAACGLAIIYLLSLSASFHWKDSPELISAAHTLGILHLNGYPIYLQAAKLFSLLPLADIGGRVNLMAAVGAVAMALAPLVLAWFLLRERGSAWLWLGVALVVGLGMTREFYGLAGVAENNLIFFVLAMLSAITFAGAVVREDRAQWRLAHWFVLGLMVAYHPLGLAFVVLSIAVLLRLGGGSPWRHRALRLCLFGAGLTALAYVPLRSLADPPISMLHVFDRNSARESLAVGSLSIVLPMLHAKLQGGAGPSHSEMIGKLLPTAFVSPSFIFLAPFGFVQHVKINLRSFLYCLGIYLLFLVLSSSAAGQEKEAVKIPVLQMYVVWSVLGVKWLADKLGSATLPSRLRLIGRGFAGVGILMILFSPVAQGMVALPRCLGTRRTDPAAAKFAEEMLADIPPSGVVLCKDDITLFPLWYLVAVEQRRPDVTIVSETQLMFFESYRRRISEILGVKFSREKYDPFDRDPHYPAGDLVGQASASRPVVIDRFLASSLIEDTGVWEKTDRSVEQQYGLWLQPGRRLFHIAGSTSRADSGRSDAWMLPPLDRPGALRYKTLAYQFAGYYRSRRNVAGQDKYLRRAVRVEADPAASWCRW